MKYVISIAGFDPSSGAGVTADIKTFEANSLYGFGITTAITYQSDNSFLGLDWITEEQIIKQLEPLKKFDISGIKIGIIENFIVANKIIDYIKHTFPNAIIVLDPVIKASAGYIFQNDLELFSEIQKKVTVVCPNLLEAQQLTSSNVLEDVISKIKSTSNVVITGVVKGSIVYDVVINENKVSYLELDLMDYQKHGSGCVFSSSLLSALVNGFNLKEAAIMAQKYTRNFLLSDQSLLGKHYENK